jgi:hypothetical protein
MFVKGVLFSLSHLWERAGERVDDNGDSFLAHKKHGYKIST